jgi:hypothetical protein
MARPAAAHAARCCGTRSRQQTVAVRAALLLSVLLALLPTTSGVDEPSRPWARALLAEEGGDAVRAALQARAAARAQNALCMARVCVGTGRRAPPAWRSGAGRAVPRARAARSTKYPSAS